MRRCYTCKEVKELTEFYNRKGAKDGKRSWCKTCDKAYGQKDNIKENKTDSDLRRRYGITLKQKQDMYANQNGRCAICKDLMKTVSLACLDHSHETGKIRKLLCRKCNLFLGFYEKYPAIISEFEEYLKRNG